jgi:type I restriction enzyme S subunit
VQWAKEATEKVIAATRQLKASLLKHLFTYGPIPSGECERVPVAESEAGLIPEAWPDVTLGDVSRLVQYGTSARCGGEATGYPVLRIPNVIGGFVVSSDLKYLPATDAEARRFRLERGDLIFVRTNAQRNNVGRCAVFGGLPQDSLFASYLIRVGVNEEEVLPDFIRLFAETSVGRASLSGRASGAADGKFNINGQTIRSMPIPMPGLAVQRQVVDVLSSVDSGLAAEEKRREALDALFKSLLHHLMTAKLRLPEFAGGRT